MWNTISSSGKKAWSFNALGLNPRRICARRLNVLRLNVRCFNPRPPIKESLFAFLFLIIVFNASAFGRREAARESQNTLPLGAISLTGTIALYGSEPRPFAGIVGRDGAEYAIYPLEAAEELKFLQGHLIEFIVIPLGEDEARGLENLFPGRWVRLHSYRIMD